MPIELNPPATEQEQLLFEISRHETAMDEMYRRIEETQKVLRGLRSKLRQPDAPASLPGRTLDFSEAHWLPPFGDQD